MAGYLRSSIRRLAAGRWLYVVSVLLLGIAGGFQSGVGAALQTVVLRPLPFPAPDRLVVISERRDTADLPTTFGNYRDWREQSTSFASLGAFAERPPLVADTREPQSLRAVLADGGFFETLGLVPVHGRFFAPHEQGHEPVAVLSHATWRQQFGGVSDLDGLRVSLDGIAHAIIGVSPPSVQYVVPADIYVPLAPPTNNRGQRVLRVIGRLGDQRSTEAATDEMSRVVAALETRDRDNAGFRSARVVPLRDRVLGNVRGPLLSLGLLAVFLTIGVTASVFGMQLVQADKRQHDMAIRAALGGSPFHLAKAVVVDGLVLGALAFLVAGFVAAGLRAVTLALTDDVWVLQQFELTLPALILALVACVAIGVLVTAGSVLPLPHRQLEALLRRASTASGASPRANRLRAAVIVTQTGLATALIIAATTLAFDVWQTSRIDPGFDSDGLWLVTLKAQGGAGVSTDQQGREFVRIAERLRALPGVTAAGGANRFPLVGLPMVLPITVQGLETGRIERAQLRLITPGYAEALRVPLRTGRLLSDRDDRSAPRVAVVNRSFQERYWPGQNAVGRAVRIASSPWFTIVGVTDDVRSTNIRERPQPEINLPALQVSSSGEMSIALRTSGVVPSSGDVRAAVREISSTISVAPPARVATLLALPEKPRRFAALLVTTLAGICALLSIAGTYALSVQTVSERRSEMAVRLACGADERSLAYTMSRFIVLLHALGVAAGAVLMFAGAPWVRGGIGIRDPIAVSILVGTAVPLLLAGSVATYLPMRRMVHGPLGQLLRHP
jgi:putative ABC transport system permease protein